MNKRDSHTFVFGDDVLRTMSQTSFDDIETMLTDPFTQSDEGESSVQGETARGPQSREQAKFGSELSSKGTVVMVRKSGAVATSKRSSQHSSRAGTDGARRDSARIISGKQKAGVEALYSVG
ncbi:hypothetical protein DPSP01_004258 [Paraphaeosphaeria sporulosa]